MHRILVTGGRDYADRGAVRHLLEVAATILGYDDPFGAPITLVHGDCKRYLPDGRVDPGRSADQLAHQEALALRWHQPEPHPVTAAMRDRYGGTVAPVMRNAHMVKLGADLCVSFPGGRGTTNCTMKAAKAGIRVIRLEHPDPSVPTLF